eukprot:TRINITY_DN3663_c0_g1_i2.p1 TRINITY_DN3663_c0_g1~~TRINITY_DN3663_c0_g1_i2.p1  ORF type:complete len:502 (+),score=177.70 TRINITY_DN3663_c0_g1_i2:88-1593(+)
MSETTTTKPSSQQEGGDKKTEFFEDLDVSNEVTELESLCMNCHEMGTTKLLMTKVPYFKEIILMAFECPHCDFKSSEVQYGGQIGEKGVHYEINVTDARDLNRQVVKADTATVLIPSLEFEIPSQTQRGSLNTIEGFLSQSIEGLQAALRNHINENPETASKVAEFISRLSATLRLENGPFMFILDDPSGNSYVENPAAPKDDPHGKMVHYKRTPEQDKMCGLSSSAAAPAAFTEGTISAAMKKAAITPHAGVISLPASEKEKEKGKEGVKKDDKDDDDDGREVMSFPGTCSMCFADGEVKMIMTDIPYFKQIVLMAFTCTECGYKTNEIKAGGAISEKGRKVTLRVTTPEDLSRDILKSETASVEVPELELELAAGTLGGRFTTIEGLLTQIQDELEKNPFVRGDSADPAARATYDKFIGSLERFRTGGAPFTLILDDPVSNSHIQNLYAPDPDPNMTIEEYERSFDQNEELGLNDIKTEGYGEPEEDEDEGKGKEKASS